MSRTRGLLLASLGIVVLVWAASSATLPSRSATEPQAPPADRATPADRGPLDLETAASRLKARLDAAASEPRPPVRDPFRFGPEGPKAEPVAPRPADPLPAVTLPPVVLPPPMHLTGIAARTVEGKIVRTAVIAQGDRLLFVAAGDRIDDRYEVVAVGTEAVELRALPDGPSQTLVLR